ncbi:hypothetical protein TYM08_P2599 [Marinicellulosiphila megalodicopiae]
MNTTTDAVIAPNKLIGTNKVQDYTDNEDFVKMILRLKTVRANIEFAPYVLICRFGIYSENC